MISESKEPFFDLGDLIDPARFHDSIDTAEFSREQLLPLLRSMKTIRFAEQCLAKYREQGVIGGPVHLGVGQEAIAVGVSMSLNKNDRVFGAHRSHSHLLALGSSLHGLFAEVLGKDAGHSRGMGGSMHLWDVPNGFYGAVPIVAGTVPLAVGAGLAAKLQGQSDVAVCYLGDGAIEEGVVHESLNLARIQNIPVIFVVENNLFASHMHISTRQPMYSTARFAAANGIPYQVIDGNDVVSISSAADNFIEAARSGQGPGFIEAITFRWYGHVDWREDIDVGIHRSVQELHDWRSRDPIARLSISMGEKGFLSKEEELAIDCELQSIVDQAWAWAMEQPYPEKSSLLERVYAERGN